jgi:hypothetical protein
VAHNGQVAFRTMAENGCAGSLVREAVACPREKKKWSILRRGTSRVGVVFAKKKRSSLGLGDGTEKQVPGIGRGTPLE